MPGRITQVVRGLKYEYQYLEYHHRPSHHASGAWIEILNLFWAKLKHQSHHASGAWIEIDMSGFKYINAYCRITQVVRGLK